MLSKYPVYEEKLHNAEAEAAYQLVLDCAQGIRSLKADFKEAGQGMKHIYRLALVLFR